MRSDLKVAVTPGRRQGAVAAAGSGKGQARVLIGGVGYRWLGDASFGLAVSDHLAGLEWPPGVEVSDLGYGALHVAFDLAEAHPPYDCVILLAGVARGREPGDIYRYRWERTLPEAGEIQARVFEAAAGVIDLDHLLVVAGHLGALPAEVVVIEMEPVEVGPGAALSSEAARLLPEVCARVRREAHAPFDAEKIS